MIYLEVALSLYPVWQKISLIPNFLTLTTKCVFKTIEEIITMFLIKYKCLILWALIQYYTNTKPSPYLTIKSKLFRSISVFAFLKKLHPFKTKKFYFILFINITWFQRLTNDQNLKFSLIYKYYFVSII